MKLNLKKLIITTFTFLFFLASPLLALAEESTAPPSTSTTAVVKTTGPQGPTGPASASVGPQGPTGVQGAVGVQGEVGANANTGPASDNTNSTSSDSATTVTTDNTANIDNNVNLDINTGANTIGANTVVGNVTTGAIDGSATIINVGNSNLAEGSSIGATNLSGGSGELVLTPSNARTDLTNDTTGPDSNNTNDVTQNNSVEVVGSNDATADNIVVVTATSGQNTVSNNTKVGDMMTGDINLDINLINFLNTYYPNLLLTMDIWNILGNYNGDIVLNNAQTGPGSSNDNSVDQNLNKNIEVTQNADVSNYFNFNTNTGGNTLGSNTISGGLTTGDTNISGSVTNIANVLDLPMFYIFNVYGHWNGDLMGLDSSQVIVNEINDTTGPDSTNANQVATNSDTSLKIDNNAEVNNKIDVTANTGDNTFSNNTMAGKLTTGAINISANVVNILNSFSDEVGKFALGIINIFGNWTGNAKDKSSNVVTTTGSGNSSTKVKTDFKVNETQIESSSQDISISIEEEQEVDVLTGKVYSKRVIKTTEPKIAGVTQEKIATTKTNDKILARASNDEPRPNFMVYYLFALGALCLTFTGLWWYFKTKMV